MTRKTQRAAPAFMPDRTAGHSFGASDGWLVVVKADAPSTGHSIRQPDTGEARRLDSIARYFGVEVAR